MISREYYNSLLTLHNDSLRLFAGLKSMINDRNFNTQPDAGSWSAAECLNHLLITNSGYIPQIKEALDKVPKRDLGLSRFRSTIAGTVLVKSITQEVKFRFRTPKKFKPLEQIFQLALLDEYTRQETELSELFSNSSNISLSSIKIYSPASSFVKYNLGETFRIIFQHNIRHINQANRAILAQGEISD